MFCISDQDSHTALFEEVMTRVRALAAEKGHVLESVALERNEVCACTGCLRCWSEQTRQCVSPDLLGDLTRHKKDSGVVLYMTPVTFGGMISTVKTAWDKDAHLFASQDRLKLVIGYGENVDDEEKSTFLDTIVLHRGAADVVHPRQKENIKVFVTRSGNDTRAVCEELRNVL